jgi:hypothetical protein
MIDERNAEITVFAVFVITAFQTYPSDLKNKSWRSARRFRKYHGQAPFCCTKYVLVKDGKAPESGPDTPRVNC